ncbi:winged helix-turn-helix domain-containing protein [Pandoraea sputorum]|uniref:OmpR/PhoB-type domain-containing protein n=1 Tax=Pandoraea sputorum TaxID=93222 RepID=A0A5E5B4Z2_9BURK|nr:winged helix-turn-helix domain-containing protein [Pandoraea sputorum]VVE80055.1 hypothetical protein PSP31121_02470 [Pandoraea sputorum]
MVKFLIGDIAGFDTDTFALVSQRDATLSVPLGATAGRCLQVLLEANGEIVTKRTLLAQGWEQYGAVVTDNNLSQSIVRIRKALQQLGVDPAVLATLPRIGYRLTSAKRVTPFVDALPKAPPDSASIPDNRPTGAAFSWDNTQNSPISKNLSDAESGALETPVSAGTSDPAEHVTTTSTDSPHGAPTSAIGAHDASHPPPRSRDSDASVVASASSTPAATNARRSWWPAAGLWFSVAAISAALAAWVVPSLRGDLRTNANVAQWAPLDDTPGNRAFVAPDFKHDSDFVKQRLARLASTPPLAIDDAHERYVYINGSGSLDVFSYFLCRAPIGRADSECLSYLLIDHASS